MPGITVPSCHIVSHPIGKGCGASPRHWSACVSRLYHRSNKALIRVGGPAARPVACFANFPVVGEAVDLSHLQLPILSGMLDSGEQYALLLSTLAGLSTSIGGGIAIVKKPGNDLLSFLLGIAIGVMATLSVLEMWLHNAAEHGVVGITAASAAGVALYYVAQPYFPNFEQHQVCQNMVSWLCSPTCAIWLSLTQVLLQESVPEASAKAHSDTDSKSGVMQSQHYLVPLQDVPCT